MEGVLQKWKARRKWRLAFVATKRLQGLTTGSTLSQVAICGQEGDSLAGVAYCDARVSRLVELVVRVSRVVAHMVPRT